MITLVTGANGFVGTRVVRCAVEHGLVVRGSDRQPAGVVPDVEYIPADILAPESLAPAVAGVGCVIHVAGLAHVFDRRQAAAAPFHAVNALGTEHVARAAARAGVRHFVLVSSVSVYGPHADGILNETAACAPDEPYAISKHEAESRAVAVARDVGMAVTVLRMATIYGEGDPGNVARLIRTIDRGRFIWVGVGRNRKSLLHRDDAARACVIAAGAEAVDVRVFNVSAPVTTMREVVEVIAGALERPLPRIAVPAGLARVAGRAVGATPGLRSRLANIDRTLDKWLRDDAYDASRIEAALGFRAEVTLEAGIGREVRWYRQSR